MKFSTFPGARGLAWFGSAWTILKAQAIRLLLISLFFQFFLSFAQAGILGLVVLLCMPVLSAGLLHSLHMAALGQKPMLAMLFVGFSNGKSLSKLLLLGAIVMVIGLMVVTIAMSGQVMSLDPELLSRIEQGDMDAIQAIDPHVIRNAMISMLIGAAISGTLTYFAVPLIWFKDAPVGQALLLGLTAMAKNWRPLLLIALLLAAVAIPIGLLFGIFFLAAVKGGAAASAVAFLILLFGPLFQLLVYSTQYVAFRDIFRFEVAADNRPDNNDGQLVA